MKVVDKNKFSNTTIEALGWYVYLLKDPRTGEVFYVGKGCGNRVFAHVTESIVNPKHTDKLGHIRNITDAGYEVIHVIHRHGMTEEAAFEVEASLIDLIPGLTNAVLGNGAVRGPKSIKQINEMYDPEVADFGNLKVLMIKINNSYGNMNVVDATCFSWKLDAEKMMKADVILGVAHGVVRCVLKPKGWHFSSPITDMEMWNHYGFAFDDEEQRKRKVINAIAPDHDLQDRFIGKAIPEQYSLKGSQQALRYNY